MRVRSIPCRVSYCFTFSFVCIWWQRFLYTAVKCNAVLSTRWHYCLKSIPPRIFYFFSCCNFGFSSYFCLFGLFFMFLLSFIQHYWFLVFFHYFLRLLVTTLWCLQATSSDLDSLESQLYMPSSKTGNVRCMWLWLSNYEVACRSCTGLRLWGVVACLFSSMPSLASFISCVPDISFCNSSSNRSISSYAELILTLWVRFYQGLTYYPWFKAYVKMNLSFCYVSTVASDP